MFLVFLPLMDSNSEDRQESGEDMQQRTLGQTQTQAAEF